jgi:hypothetical protein
VEEEVVTAGETEELGVVGKGTEILSDGERAVGIGLDKGAEDCALGAGMWVIVTGEGLGGTCSGKGRRERVTSVLEG